MHPNAPEMVTEPPPDVFAAANATELAVVCDPAVSAENVFDPSARPPDVQLVTSVTSFVVVHVPVLNPVLATAADASGETELLNRAALTVSLDRLTKLVGAAVDQTRPRMGLIRAWVKIREVGELSVHPAIYCSPRRAVATAAYTARSVCPSAWTVSTDM